MTRKKWMIAGVAAFGLALASLPFMGGQVDHTGDATSGQCDPRARPANFDFVLQDMHGQDVRLADYRGQVILLNFWATWCPPCKVEIPDFVELQERYRDQGVVFLGFSIDDTPEELRPFAEQYKMNYPVIVGAGREDVQEAYGPIWGLPVTVMINREGKICKRHLGLATKEQVEQEIEALL